MNPATEIVCRYYTEDIEGQAAAREMVTEAVEEVGNPETRLALVFRAIERRVKENATSVFVDVFRQGYRTALVAEIMKTVDWLGIAARLWSRHQERNSE